MLAAMVGMSLFAKVVDDLMTARSGFFDLQSRK